MAGARPPSAWVAALARAVTWTFYRVERRGAPPAQGAALLVVNHPNALLDPAVVWATAGRDVRFLAKAPLFRVPVLGWILRAARAIPVYRAQDAADTSKNAAMFADVQAALRSGDAVCIFPEGTSHSTGRLEPLRTGAARIALAATAAGTAISIAPVGLNFFRKSAFRSRAAVVYGQPLQVSAALRGGSGGRGDSAPSAADVRELTARIADAMRKLLVEVDPIADAAIVERIDRLYSSARAEARAMDRVERRRIIATGIDRLRANDPEWYAEIADRVRTYDARLRRFGLRDRDLDGRLDAAAALRFAAREAVAAILLAPLVIAGFIIFFVPYRLTDWLATRFTDLDVQATAKVVGGAIVHAVWVALLAWLAWRATGLVGAVAAIAALPVVAFASLFAIEREMAVAAAVRGWLALRRASPRARAHLTRTRAEIADVLEEVRGWLEAAGPPTASSDTPTLSVSNRPH